ncbi:MAG: molybdopterin-binding protein [Candidatus Caldatribacteriota bacterium]
MAKDLFQLNTLERVIQLLRDNIDWPEVWQNRQEEINFQDALGRVLAEEVISPLNLPGFIRATMDGYAIRAEDSFGVSESLPAYLTIIGEVKMGEQPTFQVNQGEAAKISTGGMLPEGSNAVVMWEYTNQIEEFTLEVKRPVAPGENVTREDEDLKRGEKILNKGHRLRPQDIGVLAGIGKINLKVFKKPQLAIISTGNEIVPPNQEPLKGEIRDINTYSLGTSVIKLGGIPLYKGIIKDKLKSLKQTIMKILEEDEAQGLIISGGSSLGMRDITLEALTGLGKPGILAHGISIKPGKPTIVAVINNKPIIGLPGHPVSALIIFHLLMRPLISWLQGEEYNSDFSPQIEAIIDTNIASDPGREEYIRVTLYKEDNQYYAKPIWGKSGIISTLVRSSGLVKIGLNIEGLKKGSRAMVELF